MDAAASGGRWAGWGIAERKGGGGGGFKRGVDWTWGGGGGGGQRMDVEGPSCFGCNVQAKRFVACGQGCGSILSLL